MSSAASPPPCFCSTNQSPEFAFNLGCAAPCYAAKQPDPDHDHASTVAGGSLVSPVSTSIRVSDEIYQTTPFSAPPCQENLPSLNSVRLDRLKSEYVYTVVPGQEAKHCHSFEAIMGVMDGIPKTKLSMPKLSITFKGLPLQTVELKPGETGIGRDTSNTICIDSLAVADFHADIRSGPEGYVIRPLQAGYPITVNKHSVTEHLLADGDHILIGKHSLYFTEERTADGFGDSVETRPVAPFRPFEGSFQVMNGKQIGMVIPLRATVTQIGKESTGMVIVTRGSEGYVIAAGSDNVRVTINGQALKNRESALSDGDIVRINSSLLQFFQR